MTNTRGALGFRINGVDKIAYNDADSYPTGLLKCILTDIQCSTDKEIKEAAANITLVHEHRKPSKAQIDECKKCANLDIGAGTIEDWYTLLQSTQGNLSVYTKNGLKYMVDSVGFLADSLFCEWAYIINVDTGNLEVYEGFNHNKQAKGRYACLTSGGSANIGSSGSAYFGVALIKEIPLAKIRTKTFNINELCEQIEKPKKPVDND
jgi:hypothetical protein